MYIYVAGPLYGSGYQDDNVRLALRVAEQVLLLGHTPFVPHLYFFWNLIHEKPAEHWLNLDRQWLLKCNGMIRIVGTSPGSSKEEGWCDESGLPWVERAVSLLTPDLEFSYAIREAVMMIEAKIQLGIK